MIPQLYAHPFSSYSQKALIAFYENNISFEFRILEPGNASAIGEWAVCRMPRPQYSRTLCQRVPEPAVLRP